MSRVLKDSGVEWIGKIPENWNMVYLKHLYSFEKGKNAALYTKEYVFDNSGEYPVYSGQTEDNGVMGNIKTYDYDMDECLFTTTVGAKVMTTKILSGKFSLSQNCLIMKRQAETNTHFNYYVLNALFDYEKSKIPSYMQPSLRIEDLKTYKYFIPPLLEQQKIADFLDKKCSKIDEQKANYEKSIELLKEYKQSLITKAVTKGINPNCKLKDSGIDWIGEIPEDWEIKRLKYLVNINTGNEDTQNADPDGEYPFYVRSPIIERCNRYSFEGESILMAGDGAGAGRVFHHANGKYAVHQRVYIMYDFKCNPSFLHYYLVGFFPREMDRGSAQSTVPSVRLPMLLNFRVTLPNQDIQQQIVEYLDKECSKIDKVISYREQMIEKLEEYKKSLIYESVTGKKEIK